jgi:hypothetical protein
VKFTPFSSVVIRLFFHIFSSHGSEMMNSMINTGLKFLVAIAWLVCSLVLSQEDSSNGAEEIVVPDSPYLVINEIGLGVGYPTYQLYHLHYAFQRDVFGVAFRGSYTGEGLYLSLAGRYYTPLPIPVPTFVSAGAGIAGSDPTVFATFGLHAPLGLDSNFRATLEAGLAYVGGTGIQPVATLGVGYVFYVDTAPISEEEKRRRELEQLRAFNCQPTDPDPTQLEDALDDAIDDFIEKARAQYAGAYSNLEYNKQIRNTTVNGVDATMEVFVSGSVLVKATRKREGANGTITAYFGWNGCSWSLLRYDADF